MTVFLRMLPVLALIGCSWLDESDGSSSSGSAQLRAGNQATVIALEQTAIRTRFGLEPQTLPTAELGILHAGRISPDGESIVLLDAMEHYIKVFRRDGTLRSSFGQEGAGPGKLRRPSAIAVSDEEILVITGGSGQISIFGYDGNLLRTIPHQGSFIEATAACGSGWVIYGPIGKSSRSSEPEVAVWLHLITRSEDGSYLLTSAFSDSLPKTLRYRAGNRIIAIKDGAIVHHDGRNRSMLLRVRCPDAAGEFRVEPLSSGRPNPNLNSHGQTFVLSPDNPQMGIAAVSDMIAVADIVSGTSALTRIQLLKGVAAARELWLDQPYMLLDSRPDVGVLLSSNEPVPQALLVEPQAIFQQ